MSLSKMSQSQTKKPEDLDIDALQRLGDLAQFPTEVRVKIYEFAFTPNHGSDIRVDITNAPGPSKSLLSTCRKIHNEARKLYLAAQQEYWSSTRFFLDISAGNCEKDISSLLAGVRDKDVELIRRLEIQGPEPLCTFHDGVWMADDSKIRRTLVESRREQTLVVERNALQSLNLQLKDVYDGLQKFNLDDDFQPAPNARPNCSVIDPSRLWKITNTDLVVLSLWSLPKADIEVAKALGWQCLSKAEIYVMIRKNASTWYFHKGLLESAIFSDSVSDQSGHGSS